MQFHLTDSFYMLQKYFLAFVVILLHALCFTFALFIQRKVFRPTHKEFLSFCDKVEGSKELYQFVFAVLMNTLEVNVREELGLI